MSRVFLVAEKDRAALRDADTDHGECAPTCAFEDALRDGVPPENLCA